jgi:hypothetical protein
MLAIKNAISMPAPVCFQPVGAVHFFITNYHLKITYELYRSGEGKLRTCKQTVIVVLMKTV